MRFGKVIPLNEVVYQLPSGGTAFVPPFTGPHSKAMTSDVADRIIKHLKSVSNFCVEENLADEAKNILELFGEKP